MSPWYYVLGVLGLAVLMVVHEAGHYIAARAFGMRVSTFSIGMGPSFFEIVPKDGFYWFTTAAEKVRIRLWRHIPEKHGPTVYRVAMIPFMAYVKIDGMNPFDDIDPNDKGSYANARVLARIVTIFAGSLSNYLFASVFFFFAFQFGGKPATVMVNGEPQLPAYVAPVPGRPAQAAGVRAGDRVVEIGGVTVQTWDQMAEQISKRPDKDTEVVIERDGQRLSLHITPTGEKDDKGEVRGKIGVAPERKMVPVSTREAALLSVTEPPKVVKGVLVTLWKVITRKADPDLGGPKRIIEEAARAANVSMAELLSLLGMLSAYLGAFNLLPFPALDGGRLVFLGYEAATRRRPDQKLETAIHSAGFAILIGLVLYVTIFKDFQLGPK
jgi:regulator of sigma E protease